MQNIQDILPLQPDSLINVALSHVSQNGLLNVGLLASPTTIKRELFGSSKNFTILDALGQTETEIIIREVIAGNANKVKPKLEELIKRLKQAGATRIILGCTELSVVMDGKSDESLIDPLTLVVDAVINKRNKV